MGLWLTHLQLLEAAHDTQVHLHLIEDDTVLARNAVERIEKVLAHVDVQFPDWDLIFTDAFITTQDVDVFCLLHRLIQQGDQTGTHALVDLHAIRWGGASSVLINKNSVGKLAALLANEWQHHLPIDLYLRHLVHTGKLKAYLTVPFLTSISPDSQQSDIRGAVSRSVAVAGAYRRAFFLDADLPALFAEIQELTSDMEKPTLLREIYLRTLQYRLSDRWEHF